MSADDRLTWIKPLLLKIGSIALLIVGFIIVQAAGLVGGEVAESHFEHKQKESAKQAINESMNELRSQLPMRLDERTTLVETYLNDTTIVYGYEVNLDGFDSIEVEEIMSHVKSNNTDTLCNSSESVAILDLGFSYRYTYHNSNGINVSNYKITRSTCNNP